MRVVFHESVPADKRAVCVQIPKGYGKDGDEKHAKKKGVARPFPECVRFLFTFVSAFL